MEIHLFSTVSMKLIFHHSEQRIPTGNNVTLTCTGSKNYLNQLGEVQEVQATCVGGLMLDINGEVTNNENKIPLKKNVKK